MHERLKLFPGLPPTNTEAVRLRNNSHTLTTANLKNSGISDDTHVSSSGVKHKILHLNQHFESLYGGVSSLILS